MRGWDTYQLQSLVRTYNGMSNESIAKLIGKTKRAVELTKMKLNLVRNHPIPFTTDDIEFLQEHFQTLTNKQLGKLLKRTPGTIAYKLHSMNLKRTLTK